jgi:hypothetical protein
MSLPFQPAQCADWERLSDVGQNAAELPSRNRMALSSSAPFGAFFEALLG